MERGYLRGWPVYWPPPDVFFGPLAVSIAGIQTARQELEYQVIVRFKNRYGVKISQSRLHEGLYVVVPLKYHGPGIDHYAFAGDGNVLAPTWCFTSDEVYALCQEVALWQPR